MLIIFVNQTNARFYEMYQLARRCCGQIQDVAGIATAQLPPASAQRLVRYLNAAHVAGYVGLCGPYNKSNFFDEFNREYNLLNDTETKRVERLDMDSGADAFKELVTWCQKDVSLAKKSGHIDSIEAAELHNRILNVRASMDGIYDACDQPVAFFYIHFLCLLSALYLPLFAVDNAFSAGWGENIDLTIDFLNGIIVVLQSIFVVGLQFLGKKMMDPFGDDVEDLSVMTYVSTTIHNTRIISTVNREDEIDTVAEEMLQRREKPSAQSA